MTLAIKDLGKWAAAPDTPYTHFDLGLTKAQQAMLANMRIDCNGSYDNFGAPDTIANDTAFFLEKIGNGLELAARQAKIIAATTQTILSGFEQEACWVSLRATTPSDEYDIPRWHFDGSFYKTEKTVVKAAMVFKGPHTLLAILTPRQHEHFMHKWRYGFRGPMPQREKLALLVGKRHTSAPHGQGSSFIVGNSATAAIHSEPPFAETRLFASVLPGSCVEIEELRTRWKIETRGIRISDTDYKL